MVVLNVFDIDVGSAGIFVLTNEKLGKIVY